ncbi:MAG: hypothetical protein EXS05_03185 [Planctomycetaceae bacterium]|nr:hypothetical protein [Planctomycetaceae bacterium]
MRNLACLMVGCVALVTPAVADESARTLPADGTWVRYFATAGVARPDETILHYTYSLVGTKTVNDQVCRWVEMKTEVRNVAYSEIVKLLIPERELLEGKTPVKSLVRGWTKMNDDPVQSMLEKESIDDAEYWYGWTTLVYPGPQRDAKVVRHPRIVEYQDDRLDIAEGREMTYTASRRDASNGNTYPIVIEAAYWTHPKVPLGWASAKLRVEYRRNDSLLRVGTCESSVQAFGIDAKSALPDHD